MERPDVVVVGAGPAGATASFELARRGHSVVLVEEHAQVGEPVQCAGLVSQRVLDLAGSRNFVRQPVRGASVFGPSLSSVSFRAPEPRAFVIDRAGLDAHLADRATRAGAELRTGIRFVGLGGRPNGHVGLRLVDRNGASSEMETRLVVGADGVASAVARAFRLRRPVEILPAFEVEVAESAGDPESVEVYLGNQISPGLFGWWIPDGVGGARVGVAVHARPPTAKEYCQRLERLIERRFGRPLGPRTREIVSGIPIGIVPRLTSDRALLIGDAAGQVKPVSGGGIFTGMRAAQIAAEVADAALRADDLTAARLRHYEVRWSAEFGEEFSKALYLRRLLTRLSDSDLDRVVEALRAAGMEESIVAFGDIDFPTGVARALLRQSPSLVRLFPKALSALLSPGMLRAPELEPGPPRNQ
ncbi:MAG TPA: NAD(P)/FAD-dependent oxidoreductase [Thermoplasmata archaeon]|nr:NAD(P)/FAD-dependent oxidoreductase [Thermoplasmata archaeon]